jgi:hypothetical protein
VKLPPNLFFWLAAALLLTAGPSFALQQLLPTPYPAGLGATAERISNGAMTYRHQRLLPDAVPRAYGVNAQGNPHRVRYARHQHLLHTPYPRQFR